MVTASHGLSCTQFCPKLFEIPPNFVAFNAAKNELIETEKNGGPKTYQVKKYQIFKGRTGKVRRQCRVDWRLSRMQNYRRIVKLVPNAMQNT